MAGVQITCCRCGGTFDERTLEGGWLDRRCPLCNKKLSEEVYDKAAARLGKRESRLRDCYALARYYTSEWFRLACAGQGSEAAGKGLFGLKPGYDLRTGAFTLTPHDEDRSPEGGWGVSGEYFVFDAIRAEIARPGSALCGSHLVPHLVFPWLAGKKPKQWGAKHRAEVDCVLLTRTCAVVVEVKRRSHHVRVSRDYRHIRERSEGGGFRSASEPVEQVERGADSFCERQELYPGERVCKMIVFAEPSSFSCTGSRFEDGMFASFLGSDGSAPFLEALCELVGDLDPIAGKRAVKRLAERMLDEFGNTADRRRGRIVATLEQAAVAKRKRTAAMLDALERRTRDGSSSLSGARLIKFPVCEVNIGKHEQDFKAKRVEIAGILLTGSFAFVIDAKRWPVHVNTHSPFATVYTGDADEGAEFVEGSIRHDWDLDAIHYRNRSGSLTLLNYVARSLEELDAYRERNRICTLNVFIDPLTFCTDGDDFRQRTYIGFWRGRQDNIFAALERQAASADPIMDRVADLAL